MNACLEQCIAQMCQMQPTRKEILRGVRAFRILQAGPCRWADNKLHTLHKFSEETEQLDEFWSHSWRSHPWTKYLSALFMSNGLPAFVAGMLSSFTACCLRLASVLPQRGFCTLAGAVGYYVTLVLWPCMQRIFLDVACIHQTDARKKMEGLVSMGAFLKCSKSLVVFWDQTFASRLWCVFELATFLHSRELGTGKRLVVCPTFVGAALLCGHLGLCVLVVVFQRSDTPLFPTGLLLICALVFPCLTLLAYLAVMHCCNIVIMQRQIRHFSLDNAYSICCDAGHIDNNGRRISCDRRIILRCIGTWFGSLQEFEDVVKREVLKVLVHQLANCTFSYWRAVQANSPVLWLFLDFMVWRDTAIVVLLRALLYWLLLLPSLELLLLRLAYAAASRLYGNMLCHLLLSLCLVACGACIFAGFFLLEKLILPDFLGDQLQASLLLFATLSVVSACLWCCLPQIRAASPSSNVSVA